MITGIPKEVADVIYADQFDPELRDRIVAWTEESFSLFLQRNTKKIAKKLRRLKNVEAQRDLGLELFVARMFLRSGCKVTYEPKSDGGPDFLIEFDSDQFYCEVKRIQENTTLSTEPQQVEFPAKQFRIIGDAICKKLLQLEMGHPNVIYIRSNRFTIQKCDLEEAWKELEQKADLGDTAFFQQKKFKSIDDFRERVSACSVIVLDDFWINSGNADVTAKVYTNEDAKYVLSTKMYDVIRHAITTPFRYIAPFEGVAEDDWEVLR